MMLGVILHSSLVFNTYKTWNINSNETTIIATYLIDIIHIFRMPAFFIVSGYFCLLTIKRYGPTKFFKVRIKRIAIPLVVTAITLNSLQIFILNYTNWKSITISEYLLTGGWISHLWFLVNLLVYFTIAFLCSLFFSKFFRKVNDLINKLSKPISFIIILLTLPFIWLSIKVAGKFGLPIYWKFYDLISLHELLYYSPFFIFGLWLRGNPKLLFKFSNINIFISILFLITSMIIYKEFEISTKITSLALYEYFHGLAAWSSTAICFYLFMKFANSHSKYFTLLSEASYTVYLFHHFLVIAFGLILIKYGIGGITGLSILIISVFLITFFIHSNIISKNKILSYLYNGK